MATNYPGGLDSLTNPSAGDALTSPSHSAQHANANDAIEAIETELGVNPSGTFATVALAVGLLRSGAGSPERCRHRQRRHHLPPQRRRHIHNPVRQDVGHG